MTLTFTVLRAADYEGFHDDNRTGVNYVVTISNGDVHYLQTVKDIEALVSDELFLHGYSDDEPPAADADPQ